MRFYNQQHRHYCGIDLHVKTMYVCILDAAGQVLVHRNIKSDPKALLETTAVQIGRDQPLRSDGFLGNGPVLLSKFSRIKAAPPELAVAAAAGR